MMKVRPVGVRSKNVRVCMCMHVCFYMYVCEFVCIFVFVGVCLSACLYVCLSVCLSVCLYKNDSSANMLAEERWTRNTFDETKGGGIELIEW